MNVYQLVPAYLKCLDSISIICCNFFSKSSGKWNHLNRNEVSCPMKVCANTSSKSWLTLFVMNYVVNELHQKDLDSLCICCHHHYWLSGAVVVPCILCSLCKCWAEESCEKSYGMLWEMENNNQCKQNWKNRVQLEIH